MISTLICSQSRNLETFVTIQIFQLILFQTELVHKRTISYLNEAYRRNCIETGLLEYGLPKFQTEMKDLVLEIFITFV